MPQSGAGKFVLVIVSCALVLSALSLFRTTKPAVDSEVRREDDSASSRHSRPSPLPHNHRPKRKPVRAIKPYPTPPDPVATYSGGFDYRRRTAAELAIEAKLERPTSIGLVDVTLPVALQRISQKYGFPIVLEERALQEAEIDIRRRFTHKLRNFKLREILETVLTGFDAPLTWFIEDSAVKVTTVEYLDIYESTVVYGTSHLTDFAPSQLEKWIENETAGPWMFHATSYGQRGWIMQIPGGFLVRHDLVNHQEISDLLRRLTPADHQPRPVVRLPKNTVIDYRQRSRAERTAVATLDSPVSLKFDDDTFHAVVDQIVWKLRRYRFQIVILDLILQNDGVDLTRRTTYSAADVPLRRALDAVLKPFDPPLTYLVENGVVNITTTGNEFDRMQTRIYKTNHLMRIKPDRLDMLIRVGTAGPWDDDPLGGEGPRGSSAVVHGGILYRVNTRMHREIRSILDQLSRHQTDLTQAGWKPPRNEGRKEPDDLVFPIEKITIPKDMPRTVVRFRFRKPLKADHDIEAALDRTSHLQLHGLTLQAAMRQIEQKHGIPFVIHNKQLAEEKFDLFQLNDHQATGIPLRDLLQIMLEEFYPQLAYFVQDGKLQITTWSDERKRLSTREYSTKHLHRNSPEVILNAIEMGAPGAIETRYRHIKGTRPNHFEEFANTVPVEGGIIIKTTYHNHRRIADVLRQLAALQADVRKEEQSANRRRNRNNKNDQ